MITEMDAVSKAILTDANFDFSTVTVEDTLTMLKFWRMRFANPGSACRAWITLFNTGNEAMFQIAFRALCEPRDTDTPDMIYVRAGIAHLFNGNGPKRPDVFPPLTNFDIDAAIASHGNWPKWALDQRKIELAA